MRARLRLRLLLPVAVVVSLSAPVLPAAAIEKAYAHISVTTPVLAYAGHPFTVAGRLATRGGLANTLHVLRTLEGVTTALPDVITATDGTFTFADSNGKAAVLPSYRLSYDGDEANYPTSRSVEVFIRPVPVTITLQAAPASPTPLDPVTFSGVLAFGMGEQVSSPVDLSVKRRSASGPATDVELPPVTTDADGTFAFSDLSGGGEWLYDVTFAGDESHERRTTTKRIDVGYPAQVSVELAAGESVRWGQPSRYVGRVTALEGPPVSSPLPIIAGTSGTCGWPGDDQAVTTAPDGTFELSIRPACLHDSELAVRSVNHDDHLSATTTLTNSVAKGPAPIVIGYATPSDSTTTDWLFPTGISVYVERWAIGPGLLDVYAQPYGKRRVLLKSTSVTNGAYADITYHADRRTVITAVYHGDEGLLPTSRTSVLLVRPSLRSQVRDAYRSVGGWKVFHRRTIPRISASMTPAHPGKALRVIVQKNVSGGWRTVVSRSLTQDWSGWVNTKYWGHRVPGDKFRVQTKWAGDVDHAPVSSGWRYFRFTT